MRALNLRLLAILLVATVAIGVAGHWLHGAQMRRHASFFLWQAHQAEADGRGRESLDHYRQYLRVRPDDLEARAEYGLLLGSLGVDNQAFSSLEKVLRQSPDRSDIRQELVRISIRRRPPRFRDAIVHLNHLLRSEPDNPELLTLLGRCQAAIGQDDAAVRSFREVLDLTDEELAEPQEIRIHPEQLDACEFLARLLEERYDRADQADQLMKCLVGSELPRAHILRARYLQARYLRPAGSPEDIQQALTHAQQAIRLASEEISAGLPRALSLCVVAPKAPPADGSLEQHRLAEKQTDPTMRLASLTAQARVARMLAAQCAMQGGDYELARRHAEHLRKSIVPKDALGVLLSRIDPRPRDAAGRVLLADTARLPHGGEELEPDEFSTLSLRAESLFQQDKLDQALQLLTEAVGKPGLDAAELTARRHGAGARMQSFSQRLSLANQEAAAEKFRARAESVCRVLAQQNPEDELVLARFLAQQGDLDEALDAAERGWPHAESDALAGTLGSLVTLEASDEQLRRIEAFVTEALEKNQRPRALLLVCFRVGCRNLRLFRLSFV